MASALETSRPKLKLRQQITLKRNNFRKNLAAEFSEIKALLHGCFGQKAVPNYKLNQNLNLKLTIFSASVGNSALQAFVCQKGSWKLLETLENFVKQREQRVKSRRPQIIQFYQHRYC